MYYEDNVYNDSKVNLKVEKMIILVIKNHHLMSKDNIKMNHYVNNVTIGLFTHDRSTPIWLLLRILFFFP